VDATAQSPVLRSIQPEYRPRQPGLLRKLFQQRFPAFQALYEQRYPSFYGKFRLPLIIHAASAFRLCGDWSQSIARIRCPDCGYDFFRTFSCKRPAESAVRTDASFLASLWIFHRQQNSYQ
jgi:hypothetical protein